MKGRRAKDGGQDAGTEVGRVGHESFTLMDSLAPVEPRGDSASRQRARAEARGVLRARRGAHRACAAVRDRGLALALSALVEPLRSGDRQHRRRGRRRRFLFRQSHAERRRRGRGDARLRRNGSIAATALRPPSRPGLRSRRARGSSGCLRRRSMFEGARLERRLEVETSGEAEFLIAETLVFGRLAMGETRIDASVRDSWRVRRDGRLVFADETRIDHAGATLERKAVGAGARALSTIVAVGAQYRGSPARFAGGARSGRLGRRERRERLRRTDRRSPSRRVVRPIAHGPCRVHCRAGRTQAAAVALRGREICWTAESR